MSSWIRSIRLSACLWVMTGPAALLAATAVQADSQTLPATLVSSGVERSYLLYVPDGYRGDPVPLVLSLHGSGGVPEDWLAASGLTTLADREGFAVAFPAGAFANTVSERSWNANVEPGVNDVAFVRDVITDAAAKIRIDASRVYATGFSGGARMSSRLACELADVLAAAAPVAGLQYPEGCTPARPVPLLAVHGQADRVNPFELTDAARPYWRMGVETAVQRWGSANGCGDGPRISAVSDNIELRLWAPCNGSAEIRFYVISDGGHVWPDWAPETIWDFFEQHSL